MNYYDDVALNLIYWGYHKSPITERIGGYQELHLNSRKKECKRKREKNDNNN